MRYNALLISISLLLWQNLAIAVPYKATVEYKVYKDQKLNLRVSQIPTKFDWIERDWEGNVRKPKLGSTIITESTNAIYVQDQFGVERLMPSGTKFYAKVKALEKNKSFQKDGYAQLEFYKFSIPGHGSKSLQEKILAKNKYKSNPIGKAASVGAYALGGAVAAPLAVIASLDLTGKIIGLSSGAAPSILGAAAALGGGMGLAYGLTRKGKFKRVEPGTEFNLELGDDWLLKMAEELPTVRDLQASQKIYSECLNPKDCQMAEEAEKVDLEILKVKKRKDAYGDPCLSVTFKYRNLSEYPLYYSSFQLRDSMGREYEPSPRKMDDDFIGKVPDEAELTLNYASEFLKAVHQLNVKERRSQKILASSKVFLD